MRNYRATPDITTGKSTAEIMFLNRVFKTRIPDFIDYKGEVKDRDIIRKDFPEKNIKHYAVKHNNAKPCNISNGDKVIVKKR